MGREKHLYSIYKKMKSKRKSFSEIMDIYAFRIIVDSVDTCYRVLGCIHSLYKPVPGEFKDYIAIPKANGYQSLHTVLMGMHGVPIEIQIRTREMEAMANNGIAAHWLYKTDGLTTNGSHTRAREWVQGLLEMQQRAGNSLEFIESVKIDLFPDEIYVFTPKGRILELPRGATAVDFAYAVHTDVGNSCVACRINRRLAPLSEPLQSGETVEILTAPGASPNPSWFNYAVSAKARTNIRHFLKNQTREDSVTLGRRLLDRALGAFDKSLDQLAAEQLEGYLQVTTTITWTTCWNKSREVTVCPPSQRNKYWRTWARPPIWRKGTPTRLQSAAPRALWSTMPAAVTPFPATPSRDTSVPKKVWWCTGSAARTWQTCVTRLSGWSHCAGTKWSRENIRLNCV